MWDFLFVILFAIFVCDFCLRFLFVIFVCDFCLRFLFGGCFAGCCLLAVGFSAYFSCPTPTLWVSPPTFLLPRPVSAPRHIDSLPGWAFLLAFHTLRPHYGFPRLLFYFHAQFPLRDISISFRGGFSACFSLPTPTLWVSPPAFLLPRPVFSPRHND